MAFFHVADNLKSVVNHPGSEWQTIRCNPQYANPSGLAFLRSAAWLPIHFSKRYFTSAAMASTSTAVISSQKTTMGHNICVCVGIGQEQLDADPEQQRTDEASPTSAWL
ncbi:hypothetical protein ABS755_07460 [Castellaniella sp. FW104-16D08]|uniref:hypothetical protein n=1 Tax=unclassified Castellaniella TaxID=2617606 RepID=UPI0033156DA5